MMLPSASMRATPMDFAAAGFSLGSFAEVFSAARTAPENVRKRTLAGARRFMSSASHTQRGKIEVQDCFLFLPVSFVEPPHANDLAHDLGIEAVPFGFCKHFANVRRERRLLLFQALDALDQRFQLSRRKARFGHRCPLTDTRKI